MEETVTGRELIQIGALETSRQHVIKVLGLRFGERAATVVNAIKRIDDSSVLETLLSYGITLSSFDAFEQVLADQTA